MKKIRSLAFCFITVASIVASGQIISLGGAKPTKLEAKN